MHPGTVRHAVSSLALVARLALMLCTTIGLSSEIKPNEHVIFFATAAHLSDDGQHWLTPVHGWVFEPKPGSLTRATLKRALRQALGGDEHTTPAEIFDRRISFFLVDNQRGKQIALRVGDQTFELPPSQPDGHFEGEIKIPVDVARPLAESGRLRFQAVMPADDQREFAGEVQLIGPQGVSVISDIDDTVKITEVRDRKQALENTLLQPFRPVAGMPNLYRDWSQAGLQFHFVSNSPWQLYEPLHRFLREAGFPNASFALRRFRLKDPSTLLDLLSDPGETKRAAIERLVSDYPHRRFILVGDSGERDPETYGAIARKFPGRVWRIFIRDVTGETADAARYRQAFQGLEAGTWQLFQDPAMLPPLPAERSGLPMK